MTEETKRILIIDDEFNIREILGIFFTNQGFQVKKAENGRVGLEFFENFQPSGVLVDINMPEVNGFQVIETISQKNPDIPIIVISGESSIRTAIQATRLGAWDFLLKPIPSMDIVKHTIEKAWERASLLKSRREYQKHLEGEIKLRTQSLETALSDKADLIRVIERQNQQLEQRIRDLVRDPLTKCWNQRKMVQDIETESPPTLLYLKINRFNEINDALEFEAGDAVLSQVAQIIQKLLPDKQKLYRVSGPEFAVFVDGNQEDAQLLSIRIQDSVNETRVHYEDFDIAVDLSFGIAEKDKGDILKNAHLALGQSKREGKVVIYTTDLRIRDERLDILRQCQRVQEGLKTHSFFPVYQGIRDNRPGPSYGIIPKYECLIRLRTPEKVLSPFFFLTALERMGNMKEATMIMIQKSFEHMRGNSYEFSINLSEHDLTHAPLFDFIQERFEESGIVPQRVTFEVLEGVSSSGYENVTDIMAQLKKMGCKIAIDDFGSELSNIGRLLNFEPDYIKIDARFIKQLPTDKKSRIIVENIFDLATRIGSEVVAEFVENEDIQKIVEEIGIQFSQGYLFSQPSETTI